MAIVIVVIVKLCLFRIMNGLETIISVLNVSLFPERGT